MSFSPVLLLRFFFHEMQKWLTFQRINTVNVFYFDRIRFTQNSRRRLWVKYLLQHWILTLNRLDKWTNGWRFDCSWHILLDGIFINLKKADAKNRYTEFYDLLKWMLSLMVMHFKHQNHEYTLIAIFNLIMTNVSVCLSMNCIWSFKIDIIHFACDTFDIGRLNSVLTFIYVNGISWIFNALTSIEVKPYELNWIELNCNVQVNCRFSSVIICWKRLFNAMCHQWFLIECHELSFLETSKSNLISQNPLFLLKCTENPFT